MVAVLELCLEIIPIYLLLGQPSRASLPLQLGCVEKWPLCAHCPFNLYTQHRYAKLTVTALKKNTVYFISFWDFVDENMKATGTGAVFLSSVL